MQKTLGRSIQEKLEIDDTLYSLPHLPPIILASWLGLSSSPCLYSSCTTSAPSSTTPSLPRPFPLHLHCPLSSHLCRQLLQLLHKQLPMHPNHPYPQQHSSHFRAPGPGCPAPLPCPLPTWASSCGDFPPSGLAAMRAKNSVAQPRLCLV